MVALPCTRISTSSPSLRSISPRDLRTLFSYRALMTPLIISTNVIQRINGYGLVSMQNFGPIRSACREMLPTGKAARFGRGPVPPDLWPRSSRPGDGSSCGPSAHDIRCCIYYPPKSRPVQASTTLKCAQLLQRESKAALGTPEEEA